MKKKWFVWGLGLVVVSIALGVGAVWATFATFSKVTSLVQQQSIRLSAMADQDCLRAAQMLFSSDALISNSPSENLKTLKDACFPSEVDNGAVNVRPPKPEEKPVSEV